MAIGLFRSKETYSAPLPYVYTNPQPSTMIHPNDKIYVLARTSQLSGVTTPVSEKRDIPSDHFINLELDDDSDDIVVDE